MLKKIAVLFISAFITFFLLWIARNGFVSTFSKSITNKNPTTDIKSAGDEESFTYLLSHSSSNHHSSINHTIATMRNGDTRIESEDINADIAIYDNPKAKEDDDFPSATIDAIKPSSKESYMPKGKTVIVKMNSNADMIKIVKNDGSDSNDKNSSVIYGDDAVWSVDPLQKQAGDTVRESNGSGGSFDSVENLLEALDSIGGEMGYPVLVRIFKEEKRLEVWMFVKDSYKKLIGYDLCEISGEIGPRRVPGDMQAPEGFYEIIRDRVSPDNLYDHSAYIGYPNEYDKYHDYNGSDVSIHEGCISSGGFAVGSEAQTKDIMSLLTAAFENSQPFVQVQIYPFVMSDERLDEHRDSIWYEFWKNLKEGYDLFKQSREMPVVRLKDGKYSFELPKN